MIDVLRVERPAADQLREMVVLWERCFGGGPTEEALREEHERPVARAFLARLEGEPVGFASAHVVVDEVDLQIIATHPEWRRRGVGRALLTEVLRMAREEGAVVVHLEVRVSNDPAQALYEELGFEVVGKRARYYADGEEACLMSLRLDARPA
jgi:ribosomal-protein-alanine acetyltransferase